MHDPHSDMEDRLRAGRPRLDDRRLDDIRRSIEARDRRPSRPPVLIALLLTVGFVMSLGGTGLAVSGLASDTTAVQAQYPSSDVAATSPNLESIADDSDAETPGSTGGAPEATGSAPDNDVLGETDERPAADGGGSDEGDVAGETAVLSDSAGLPFTGWAALPVLAMGLALLASGLVLRRRTQRSGA